MLLDHCGGIIPCTVDNFEELSAIQLHLHIFLKHEGRSSMLCVKLAVLTSYKKASDKRLDLKCSLIIPVLQKLIAHFVDEVRLILNYQFR